MEENNNDLRRISLRGVFQSSVRAVNRALADTTTYDDILKIDLPDTNPKAHQDVERISRAEPADIRTADAPKVNSLGTDFGNIPEHRTYPHHGFVQPFLGDTFKGRFLAEHLSHGRSILPELIPNHGVGKSEQDLASDNLIVASEVDSIGQHAIPSRLYEHCRDIYEALGLVHSMHFDNLTYRSMLRLTDELRQRQIFHYLVPPEHEDEFYHVSRMQSGLRDRGDSTACAVALVGHWLQKCWANHQECPGPNLSCKIWPQLPKRVIDLSNYCIPPSSPQSRVKIIETNASRGAYVALSYRWPQKVKALNLSHATLSTFSRGIAADDLLSEIQDACTLAKGLGIQYLWVDALCIIQETGGDWHIEAKQMTSIYMNAVFTIAVVDQTPLSVAAKEIPFVSKQEELATTPWLSKESNPDSVYRWLSKSGNFVSRPLGELDQRGWAFQEQILSGRIVSFTTEGIFWDCLHHSASSNRPAGILGDFSPSFQHSDTREFKRLLLSPEPSISREKYYWLWRRAVQSYTKRKLTKESDRLIALEGITRHMAILLDDNCVIGIWNKDALRSLVWFVEPSSKREDFEVGVQGPSWSWISVTGSVEYRLWHPYERYVDRRGERVSNKALILKLSARLEDPLRFDRFTGELTIVGALAKGFLFESAVYFVRRWEHNALFNGKGTGQQWLQEFKHEHLEDETDKYYHSDALLDVPSRQSHPPEQSDGPTIQQGPTTPFNRVVRPQIAAAAEKVSCLLLLEGGYTDMLTAHYCLLLRKVKSSRDVVCYRRIGLCALNTRHICVSSKEICTGQHESYSDCMGRVREVRII